MLKLKFVLHMFFFSLVVCGSQHKITSFHMIDVATIWSSNRNNKVLMRSNHFKCHEQEHYTTKMIHDALQLHCRIGQQATGRRHRRHIPWTGDREIKDNSTDVCCIPDSCYNRRWDSFVHAGLTYNEHIIKHCIYVVGTIHNRK